MTISNDETLLSADDRSDVGRTRKEIWNATRTLQNSPTAAIHRYGWTGKNASRMIAGTRTDSGVSGQACTVSDFSKEEAQRYGGLLEIGDKMFVFYGYQVLLSDIIEYPEGSDTLWDAIRVTYNAYSERCDVLARKQKA